MTPAASRSRWQSSALVAIAAMGWGTWPFFLRHAEEASPVHPAIEATASVVALTLLAALCASRDRVRVRATPRDWAMIAVLGVCDALNVVFFFAAYQRTSVAIAVLTHYLTPTLVALAAPLVLSERWTVRTLLSVAVSSLGLVLLLAPWSATRHPGDLVGALLGAASAVCYATNLLTAKRLVPVFSGSEMSFFHGFVAVPLLVVLVPSSAWGAVAPATAAWLLAGALVPGAVCGLLFMWGLRGVKASHASNLTLLEPLVATLGATLALHEELGAAALVGGGLILTGAAAAVTGESP